MGTKIVEGRTSVGKAINKQGSLSESTFTRQTNSVYGTIVGPVEVDGNAQYTVRVRYKDANGDIKITEPLEIDGCAFLLAGSGEPQDFSGLNCNVNFCGPTINTGKVIPTEDFTVRNPELAMKANTVAAKGVSFCPPGSAGI